MKQLLTAALLLSSFALVAGSAASKTQTLCPGILPPNDFKIPVGAFASGGLTEAEFNGVMDRMDAYFIPVVKAKGKTYTLNRLWTDDTVNANASEQGDVWTVNMYGGLARHPLMTIDGMQLVACHETGHHMGGAPKEGGGGGGDPGNPFPFPFPFPGGGKGGLVGTVDGGGNPFPFPFPFPGGGGGGMAWATDEGGADYFANLRCMKLILGNEDNIAWVKAHDVDPVSKTTCEATYTDAKDAALCTRSAEAGKVLALIFQNLSKEPTAPSFQTPDTSVVTQTFDDHPHTQCRMDTYYQAALCAGNLKQEMSDTDYKVATCIDYNKVGARPRCWFHPSASLQEIPLAEVN